MKKYSMLCMLHLVSVCSFGQIALTSGSGLSYSQDFNSLVLTGTSVLLPQGWVLSEANSNADITYRAGKGSATTGDTYSFGNDNDADRAFGGLQSTNLDPTVGVQFINNSGATITSLTISYTGEQWRLGATGREDRLDAQYSTDATSLTTGIWTDVNLLDFVAPVTSGTTGQLDGNVSSNRTLISSTISGLTIADGSTFWLRWTDYDATSSDDGLGVDDFSMSAQQAPMPVTLLSFEVAKVQESVHLMWVTAAEINNSHFEVERSVEGKMYSSIGTVKGNETSTGLHHYSFDDEKPNAGLNYYRLRQVDFDGKSTFSGTVAVKNSNNSQNSLKILHSDDEEGFLLEVYSASAKKAELIVTGITGKLIGLERVKLPEGLAVIRFQMGEAASGIYIVRLIAQEEMLSGILIR